MDDVRVISNYKLIRQIGIGGMGVVYLGQHTVIDRKVAIKLLRPEFSNNEDLVRRFFNEARAAAASSHPGIVEIVDVGFDQGQAFITMEYIEGETLSKYVRSRGRLHPVEAVTFARQVASALQIAHDQSIVHRDLKPSNIMVCHDEKTGLASTKVFDFGIAKLFDENSSHTRTGVVIGTPLYMSPEQCKGAGEVDTRSDLYSLGCILYFMLTGKRVFSGKGDGEIIAQHIFIEPPSPNLLAPVSDSLCGIVLRLLAKEPNDRFQTSAELVASLDVVSEELCQNQGPSSNSLQSVRAASVMPLAPPAEPATGHSQGSFPGTGSSVAETPPQIMYPSPDGVPEVVQPPTLMRRLASQGRWLAAGFAILVFIVVGLVSNGSSTSNSNEDDGEKPSLAREPDLNSASESAVVDTKAIDEPGVVPAKGTEAAKQGTSASVKDRTDKNTAGVDTGDENTVDENTADENTGDENTVDENTADENAADENTADTISMDPDDVKGRVTENSSGSKRKKNGRKNDRTNSKTTKQGDKGNTPNSNKPKTFNPFE